MKHIGFLSFGHWTPSPQSQVRSASDALLQSIELEVAAEELDAQDRRERQAVPRAAGGADQALQGGVGGGRAHAHATGVGFPQHLRAHPRARPHVFRRRARGGRPDRFPRTERAIFGRSYAAEPDVLIDELKKDEAIAEADSLLLTVPNQLGVDYNAHVIEAIVKHVAPGLGWRWTHHANASTSIEAEAASAKSVAKRLLLGVFLKTSAAYPQIYAQIGRRRPMESSQPL
jgi:hypothetical protein